MNIQIQVPIIQTQYIFKGRVDGQEVEAKHLGDFVGEDLEYWEIFSQITSVADVECDIEVPYHAHDVRHLTGWEYMIEIYDERDTSKVVGAIHVSMRTVLSFMGRHFDITDLEVEL